MTKKIFIKVDEDVYNEWSVLKTAIGKTWKEMLGFSFELLGTYYDKGMDAMIQRFKHMRARERVEEIKREEADFPSRICTSSYQKNTWLKSLPDRGHKKVMKACKGDCGGSLTQAKPH